MIKAVLFDLDGVLVDAVDWHYLALNRALSLFGYEIKPNEHHSIYNGLPTAVKLDLLTQRNEFPKSLHGFVNQMKQVYTHQIIATSCTPDMKLTSLLRHLKDQGYLLAVASNSIRSTVEMMLKKKAIFDLFDVVLSNEDVVKPKPDPEIYQKCLKMLGVNRDECMIVEDSLPGIQAARHTTSHVVVVSGPEEVTSEVILRALRTFDEKIKTSEKRSHHSFRTEKNTIEIVIPMAGLGQRFQAAGFQKPKPLIDVLNKPMIEWVVENIRPKNHPSHFTFICNKKQAEDYELPKFLSEIAPNCSIVTVPSVTEGAACTLLLAHEHINSDRPLLIANSDQWIDYQIDTFVDEAVKSDVDGLIMTFQANEKKWSFAKTDATGRVTEVAEKNPISTNATVGIYYFKQGSDFVKSAEEMVQKDIRVNGEFYVCPVYNQLLEKNKLVRIHPIGRDRMHGLGTPEDLASFIEWRTAA